MRGSFSRSWGCRLHELVPDSDTYCRNPGGICMLPWMHATATSRAHLEGGCSGIARVYRGMLWCTLKFVVKPIISDTRRSGLDSASDSNAESRRKRFTVFAHIPGSDALIAIGYIEWIQTRGHSVMIRDQSPNLNMWTYP